MRDLTEVPLDQRQYGLLTMIGTQQASDPDGQWPMWDWVEHKAKLLGLENPREVLGSLPRVGAAESFGLSYGFTAPVPRILERDTRIALTVAAAWALNEVRYDLGDPFLRVLHHMIALWRSAPRSPNQVTQVILTSEDLQLAFPQMRARIIRLVPDYFSKEPFLHSSWGKQQDGSWTMDIPQEVMWFEHAHDLQGYVHEACSRVNEVIRADRAAFLTGQSEPAPPLDPVVHIGASRTALLTWLWRQKHERSSGVPLSDVLGVLADEDLCEDQGVRFTEEEIDRASEYLETAGLLEGGGDVDQKAGPALARITAAGEDCVENYKADVSAYIRKRGSGPVTFHINTNNGNIAANSSGFTQNATTQAAVDPAQLLAAVTLIQQLAPSLTPDSQEQQALRAQVDELQAAAAAPMPDRGVLRRIGEGVLSTIRGLAHSPDVQRLAIEAVEQGIQNL
ncbi:hypothetical protein [Streptomyces sp. NPDC003273]|uniref:hypothetical protein n=1 Tax=Streptomyces sp. NPDC003273 TaxID=3364678 RepID=UPI0036B875F6